MRTRSASKLHRGRCRYRRHHPGFTLVEMLMVVAIIVLLTGILTPSIRRSIQHTYSTVCKSNLHDLGTAVQIYRGDNGGWLPVYSEEGGEHRAAYAWSLKLFADNPAGRGSLVCPADPWASILRNHLSLPVTEWQANSSYGLNEFLVASPNGSLANLDRFQPSRPGETILLADMGPDTIFATGSGGEMGMLGPPRTDSGLLLVDDGYLPGSNPGGLDEPWLVGRHLGNINILTVSGDVKEVDAGPALHRDVESYYSFCASQQCTLCLDVEVAHYSFAESRAFWWVGALPRP